MEPAKMADEANGAPSAAQTVGMNEGKDTDPPGSKDGDVEVAERVELRPTWLGELSELVVSEIGVDDKHGASETAGRGCRCRAACWRVAR